MTKTISITSGKGGVGKTTLVTNLAYQMSQNGHRVLVLDGDLGMANADIFFNVKPQGTILDVLKGSKEVDQVITSVAENLSLISGGSGLVELNRMNAFERRSLVESVKTLESLFDVMIIDTAPGISDNVLYLNSAAQEVVVVITPDPASLADSYALIKVLHQEYRENHFSIVCNQMRDEVEGMALFNRFQDVVQRFLHIGLDYLGSMQMDNLVRKSSQNQRLILRQDPQSRVGQQIQAVGARLERDLNHLHSSSRSKGGIQFFWDQVVGVA